MSEYDPFSPYDPLTGLYRSHRALLEAGSRGEAVADQLQEVRSAIREIIERRQARSAPQQSR